MRRRRRGDMPYRARPLLQTSVEHFSRDQRRRIEKAITADVRHEDVFMAHPACTPTPLGLSAS